MTRRITQVGGMRGEQLFTLHFANRSPRAVSWAQRTVAVPFPRGEKLYPLMKLFFSYLWRASHSFSWALAWGANPCQSYLLLSLHVKFEAYNVVSWVGPYCPQNNAKVRPMSLNKQEPWSVVWAQVSSLLGWALVGCLTSCGCGP